jgi:Na+/proline symporter
MASKTKKKQTSKTGGKYSSKPTAPVKAKKKERGTLLTIALLVIAIHGVFAAALYYTSAPEVQRPWIISMMVVHFLANVAAAVGIFYWKKWGLYVYAASTIIALVAGLLAVGIWSTFYMILPLVILGWLIRTKWDYFE